MVPSAAFNDSKTSREMGLGSLLVRTSLGVLVITLALQIWRPFFYLTEDSFTGFFPVAVQVCRAIWSGGSITANPYLYGGTGGLLTDPSSLGLWSPWLFIFSPVALTGMRDALVDLVSLGNSFVIAGAFASSASYLRKRLGLVYSDYLILFAALSYTFTPINLVMGSSWVGFLNAQVVYPVLLAAVHARRAWKGIAALSAAYLYGLIGGHAHPTIMAVFFGAFLAGGIAWAARSWRPLAIFAGAGAVCVVALAPVLLSTFAGFSGIARSSGFTPEASVVGRVPFDVLVNSLLFGPVSTFWHPAENVFEMAPGFVMAQGFSVVNLAALIATCLALRHRRFGRYSVVFVFLLGLTMLWIVHPPLVSFVHNHLPLLKSLRWPFRECTILLFSLHALLLWHADELRRLARPIRAMPFAVGVGAFALLALCPPPAFSSMELDRQLVLSGEADRYWAKIRNSTPASEPVRIVIGASPKLILDGWNNFPMSVLGGYNFASLFQVTSVSGYRGNSPATQFYRGIYPLHWGGIFAEQVARELYAQEPGLTLVILHEFIVPRWSLTNRHGVRWFAIDRSTGMVIEQAGNPKRDNAAKQDEQE